MFHYPMRAVSKCGNYLVPFTLHDGPCPVDKDHFVLTERENSPILVYDSILRGTDIPDLFEGDIIEVDGKEYVMRYIRGLVGKAEDDKSEIFIGNAGNFTVPSNIYNRGYKRISRNQPKFKIGNELFILEDVFGMYEGNLLLNNKGGMFVNPDEVQQHAGVKDKDRKYLYFGDKGLVLHNGRLSVEVNGEYLDLISGEIEI